MDEQNKIHLCVAYKRLTSDIRTHTDCKLRDGKLYALKMEIKRNLR